MLEVITASVLLRGPLVLKVGRPTTIPLDEPSANELEVVPNASVPSCSHPVMGRLLMMPGLSPSVPDSFLGLASSSHDPS